MLSINDVFEMYSQIGCCSFATLDGDGVDSRIAQFFAWDEEGLYLRTMDVKPFFQQLTTGKKLSVCGQKTEAPSTWDEDHLPHFLPGYMLRVTGDVRLLSRAETQEKIASNPLFAVADYDIQKYPQTCVFVLYSAWGEYYSYDFNMVNRDHKLERERFAWGGATFEPPGFTISDACIECGQCESSCTFKAIVPGTPYRILGNRCDECGNCYHVCPAGAVMIKADAI